ncbi:MAG: site-2 protease family protein [bacterium]|nr:site-2 protease family protein [bacterium]
MNSGIKLGRVFGIPIKLDFSWFIILLLVILSLQGIAPPGPVLLRWLWSIITALLIFGSVLAHELSHSYVALKKGIAMRGITLFIFGGVAETSEEPRTAREEFQIAAAGPAMSILIALVSWSLGVLAPLLHLGPGLVWILNQVKLVNLMLVVFNLIPGFPLDGGRLFRAVLWKATGNLRKATRIASNIGRFFGFLLIFIGFWLAFFLNNLLNGIWLIFIGWFLEQAARSSYQQVLLRRALSGIKLNEVMTKNVVSVPSTLTLEEVVNDYFFKYRYSSFPVVDNGMVKGFIRLNDIKNIDRTRWVKATVLDAMIPMQEQYLVAAETDAVDALTRMLRTDCRKLMVTQSGAIIGMVTLPDLMALFKIKTDLGE